jgi:hypothetical protein
MSLWPNGQANRNVHVGPPVKHSAAFGRRLNPFLIV